jgi:SSS family solute:Na+ symporter
VTRAAVVLYLPAIALSALTGIDKIWCIAAMGFVTTVYTVLGGMRNLHRRGRG